jgi:hypothetical protein
MPVSAKQSTFSLLVLKFDFIENLHHSLLSYGIIPGTEHDSKWDINAPMQVFVLPVTLRL